MATINIIGDLINDQTSGLQDDDILFLNIDPAFQNYVGTLSLSASQLLYANDVGAASQAGLVNVVLAANEVADSLTFTPGIINAPTGLTTLDGEAIFLSTDPNNLSAMLAKDASGDLVAVFYIIPNVANTQATVQVVTFEGIGHPNANDPDDRVDWGDFLKVRASTHIDDNIGDDTHTDDDGPTAALSGDMGALAVDDDTLGTNDTDDFSVAFDPQFGTDGPAAGGGLAYELNVGNVSSGIFDVATGLEALLSKVGAVIEGRTSGGDLVFVVSVDGAGNVTLDQQRAVQHSPEAGPNQTDAVNAGAILLAQTVTDGDGDDETATADISGALVFADAAPTINANGQAPTVIDDESNLLGDNTGDFSAVFNPNGGADGTQSIVYSLGVGAGVSGLSDSETGDAVNLAVVGTSIEGRTAANVLVFTISINSATGVVTLDQARAVTHPNILDPNDAVQLASAGLVTVTGTITDRDGDIAQASANIGLSFTFLDDGPAVTTSFPASDDIGNAVGQTASGAFVYDIGADLNRYLLGETDFLGGLSLTGTVEGGQNINTVSTSLQSESGSSAVFNWSFHYDADPLTAGNQDATGGGTLTIDKTNGTYQFAITDVMEGFSFDVLHTSGLFAKAPPGNTGHPELVVSQLTDPNDNDPDEFFVQFSSNSLVSTGVNNKFSFNQIQGPNGTQDDVNTQDFAFNNGDLISNAHLDWVSATQSTNGVAGDTIQKGELLTLRFFNENILGDVVPGAPEGGTEKIDPTDNAAGIAIKFDGIGNSEDLMVILNLKDALGNETTRAIRVDNADMIKGAVPAPYNTEFSLDNNDALVVIEANDYLQAGETYQIQGVQIMQSANGLTGNAINLNGAVGALGGSSGTQLWESNGSSDNDVLKIVDIGFIQTSSGTLDAALNFSLNIVDGDGDTTGTQSIALNVSNDFIV
jgi:hypothetical protein